MSMKKETGTDDVVQIVAENWFNCLKRQPCANCQI
jgi:hypothetical protein